MKKTFLSLTIFLLASAAGFSQSFSHGVALNVFVSTAPGNKAGANGGITYSPRFNFVEAENLSVSVGIPISLGLAGSYNSSYNSYYGTTSSNTLSFMLNAPVIINLNIGAGATPDADSRIGFFIGGGFGYHYADFNITDDPVDNGIETKTTFSTIGPVGNAGLRIGVGHGSHNIEIRGEYMRGLNNGGANIYGGTVGFNF